MQLGRGLRLRFSIRRKLIVLLLLAGIVPLATGMLLAYEDGKGALTQAIGSGFEELAREKAREIELIMEHRVAEAGELASHPGIRQAVAMANRRYEGKSDAEILEEMEARDREWIGKEGTGALVNSVLGSPVSGLLSAHLDRNPEMYGEIFVTDVKGAVIGATTKLTDYYQGDEGYWQAGFDEGRGQVWVEDRGYDRSAGTCVLGIDMPVRDEESGAVTGILKVNFNLGAIFNIIEKSKFGRTGQCVLARSQGRVLVHAGADPLSTSLGKPMRELTTRIQPGWTTSVGEKGQAVISGYSPVSGSLFVRVALNRWSPTWWYVFLQIDQREAFAPARELLWRTLIIGIVLAAFVVLAGWFVGSRITRPVRMLVEGTERVGGGELDYKIRTKSSDELGDLAESFNRMSRHLKGAYTELERANAELLKTNEMKSQFLSTVSHEFRTPLVVVRSFADIMAKGRLGEVTGEQVQKLHAIVRNADYMANLVNNLLDLNRIESGEVQPQLEALSIAAAVEQSVVAVRPLAEAKDIRIKTELTGWVPAVLADEDRVVQVLNNLLGNAVKFSHDGGVVTVRVQTSGDHVKVDVEDNGIGIPGEHISGIFDEFNRVPEPKARQRAGAGLGLTIVKRLVEEQGGTVWVRSSHGKGSTFSFTLRRAPAKDGPEDGQEG